VIADDRKWTKRLDIKMHSITSTVMGSFETLSRLETVFSLPFWSKGYCLGQGLGTVLISSMGSDAGMTTAAEVWHLYFIYDIVIIILSHCHGETCAPIDLPAVPIHRQLSRTRETPQSTELLTTSFIGPLWAPCCRRLSLYLHRLSR